MGRKNLKAHPSPDTLALYREIVKGTREETKEIRDEAWYRWCESINAQTTLREMWRMLNLAKGRRRPVVPMHPAPQERAEELMNTFSERCATSQLPAPIRQAQAGLLVQRRAAISTACDTPAASDTLFTPAEIKSAQKVGKDTAQGEDGVSYSMIRQSGEAGLSAICSLLNHSWHLGRLPLEWKSAVIVPIPKASDRNQMRPISLLSCLAKTCERAVQRRLLHVLGPPHPHSFAFHRKCGTAENIATILSFTEKKSAIVVFLDLEKAFELASADAVLVSLVHKGVSGKLLRWLRDFLNQRVARTRFQGHFSARSTLENGTPQGSILSPVLFNTLVENLLSLRFRTGVRLLAYADDLQLVAIGPNKKGNTQHALSLIEAKCTELALKINIEKSKAVHLGRGVPDYDLNVQNHRLQWVDLQICLGIPFAASDAPRQVLNHALTRTAPRLNVLRSLAYTGGGAGFAVLRAFYVHAIRSLVDYYAPALLTLGERLHEKLETIQNRAMRVCLGAPRWTRLVNMRMETGLIPLHLRIQQIVAGIILKALRAPRQFVFKDKFRDAWNLHPSLLQKRIWSHAAVLALKGFTIPEGLDIATEDHPHPNFTAIPPWTPLPVSFKVTPLPGPKNTCSPAVLQSVADALNSENIVNTATYYTDGSVDPATNRASASVYCAAVTASWRVTDGASTSQTELLGINQALRHALGQTLDHIVIYTDSLSAVQTLQKRDDLQSCLVTTIYANLQELQRGQRTVEIVWVPSHCQIWGNERADEAAKAALHLPQISLTVLPSITRTKTHIIRETYHLTRIQAYRWVLWNSPSASWYFNTTRYEPPCIPRSMPRKTAVIVHRLRLGYRCSWEIRERAVQDCSLCETPTDQPLWHYCLECPVFNDVRPPELQDYPLDAPDTPERASRAARVFLEKLDRLSSFPPPR